MMMIVDERKIGGVAVDAVKAFYDERPYPPPISGLDRDRQAWKDLNRRRADYHLLWPAAPFREDLDVLVAGCGTSQAAKYALCRPSARVTGIDVSSTSLTCTRELRQKYNLTNLDVHELPLERVEELRARFDLVVCTGVLHHLNDPDSGMRALGSVLKPEGALHVMVYAPYGRSGIYMLQEYCRRLGVRCNRWDAHGRRNRAVGGALGRRRSRLATRAPVFRAALVVRPGRLRRVWN